MSDAEATGTDGGSRRQELEALCGRVLELVGDRAEAEATATFTHHGLTRFANSNIHQHVGEATTGVRLRVSVDGHVGSAATSRTGDDELAAFVERLIAAARTRPVDDEWPGLAPEAPVPESSPADDDTWAGDPAARALHVRSFVDEAPDLAAAGYCDTEADLTVFVNSAGQRAVGERGRATIDGIHQTTSSAGSGHQTSDRLTDLDSAAAGRRAARLAIDGIDAGDLEPGHYQVVLQPECVATIAIFLSAYGFNGKEHLEGQSFVELDSQQFDPAIDLWDDATDERAIGLPFDAEGTPTQRLDLVSEGRSVGLTYDRRTAGRAGATSTGHAVPGGESWGPIPTNLFVGRGEAETDEMIAEVERGVLVTTFNYCRVLDPKTQVVTGLTRNGTFLIEDGEVTRPITNLRFTQSFVHALGPGNVLGVGSRLRFADSEFGPGIVVAPSMRLAEWSFTGGAKG